MIETIVNALADLAASRFIQETEGAVVVLQTLHILAICALMLSTLIVVFRSINLIGPEVDIRREALRHGRFLAMSLLVLAATGVALVLSDPARTIPTTAFLVKMVLVAVFCVLAFVVFGNFRKSWRAGPDGAGCAARYSYALMILLVVIIFLGRWIGYS